MTRKSASIDPRLRPLAKLIGDWNILGRTIDSATDNIRGTTHIRWSDGGTFQEHRSVLEVGGQRIRALEIVAPGPRTEVFPAWVFSEGVNTPLEYQWVVRGNVLSHSGLGATFRGSFTNHGRTLAGGWRPNRGTTGGPGASYDAVMTRTGPT